MQRGVSLIELSRPAVIIMTSWLVNKGARIGRYADVVLGMGYLAVSVVHLRSSIVHSDRMVKISSVFLSLSVFGGVVLVCLFVHSTMLRVSNPGYGHVLEPRRERSRQRIFNLSNSHKVTNFSLKDFKGRLSPELLLKRPIRLARQGQGRVPLHHNGVEDCSPSQNKQQIGVDTFHNPKYERLIQGEDELDAAVELATRFPFRSDFSFPQPQVMRSLEYISRASWVTDLRYYLSTYNHSREISLVTSNSKYTDVLLNWLIAATVKSGIPTKSILVISLDSTIHRLMLAKQFRSILIPPWTLIAKGVNFSQPFEEVMMTRLAVMRIINHFGYDFVMYDSDAVILKDPQPLYDALLHEDIVGSVGKIPYDLAAAWGITICIGVVLVRSSPKTGKGGHVCKQCHSSMYLFITM